MFGEIPKYLDKAGLVHDLDLVMDTIDRPPQTGDKGIYLKQQLKDKLVDHKQYIAQYGEDLPEIRNWKWSQGKMQKEKSLAKKTRVN